ncbi:uncharacterized protein [Bactrocera oleae]|uniref:uncharacterized protein n=1 Tax=Bactrocera oleae TaxID=104688 RepID=UPI00387E6FB9
MHFYCCVTPLFRGIVGNVLTAKGFWKLTITILAFIGCVAADVSHLSGSYLPPVQPQTQYLPPAQEYLPPSQPQPQYLPPAAPEPQYLPPQPQYLPPVAPQAEYLPPVAPQPQYLPPAEPQPQYLPPAPQYLPPAAPAPEYLPPVDTPVAEDGYRYRTVKKYRLRSH